MSELYKDDAIGPLHLAVLERAKRLDMPPENLFSLFVGLISRHEEELVRETLAAMDDELLSVAKGLVAAWPSPSSSPARDTDAEPPPPSGSPAS